VISIFYRTIWRFRLEIVDRQEIPIPAEAKILCVRSRAGGVSLWAAVDPSRKPKPRVIRIIGTGGRIPVDVALEYLGTAETDDDALVWHVFEEVQA
jgi:hypothetical protein